MRSVLLAAAAVSVSSISVVPEVDLLRYVGRWYQVYADAATQFIEGNYCVVTDYGLFANGTVSVRNRERLQNVTGAQNGILGYAVIENRLSLTTSDGQLSVYLQIPPPGPQGIASPYWIVDLGPKTFGPYGLYEWAVVSDPLQISLFVLARDVQDFYNNYNKTVIERLYSQGFVNAINEPRATVQDGCSPVYSETDLWTCDVHDVRPQ